MTKDRPYKILNQLFLLAQDVPPVSKARVVAGIVHKNKVIAYGTNQHKTHPMAAKFGKHEEAKCLHAEIAALINAINRYGVYILKKSTMYVARARNTIAQSDEFSWGMAKPCIGCERGIRQFGIKTAYYTTNYQNVVGTTHYHH